jgi:FAD/FMN-containing dehydrogenase
VKTILAVYDRLEDAGRSVSEIIARKMLPATLELMDRTTLNVVEESFHLGYPTDAEGALLIELDGPAPGLTRQAAMIESICLDFGARTVTAAKDEAERARLWLGRRSAFGALARRSPSYSVQDATVPRDRLVEMMRHVEEVAARYNLEVAIVAHAGDGNLHPIVLYRTPTPEQLAKVHAANGEIMQRAVAMGGTISGEHGVGIEKLDFVPLALDAATLDLMRRVKHAFDPYGCLNPRKAIPGAAPDHDRVISRETLPALVDAGWPRGQGTRSRWACPSDQLTQQVAPLSSQRGILAIDSGNLTMRVQAGTPSAEIRSALANEGFWLPALDHGWHGTVGGDVATAQPAPTDAQLGGIGRWVLGGRLVLPHGQPVHLGGRTMKNVTGYNLVPLLTGSYGQLGRIDELTLRLWPRPEADVTLTCTLAEWISHLAAPEATVDAPVIGASWDIFNRLVHLTRPVAVWAAGGLGQPASVLVRLAGIAEDVTWATRTWMDTFPVRPLDSDAETDPWQQWRQPWHIAAQSGHLSEWRGCPTALPVLLPSLAAECGQIGWSACLIAGNGYAAGPPDQLEGLAATLLATGLRYHRRGYTDAAKSDSPVDRRLLAAFAPGRPPVAVGGERA